MDINWGMVLDYGVTLILVPLIGYIGAKDVFLLNNRLTQEEYEELTNLLATHPL